ncbi:FAD-binding oxidoreductase [Anaerocolumna jejuensis]|uniref:FAD-binding oxidoreductase n=1 Tax=Anaerocolumna jejuensis TaxID=259063 RepID=UPI003F7C54F2
MAEILQELNFIIQDKNRIITENIEDKYLSDTLGRLKGTALAVVLPVSTNEVSGIMKWAYDREVQVTPRGAGTNLVGSTVPDQGGIVLDLTLMNHILELDFETFTATVEPGVILQDFQAYVEEKGLFYPPDPGEKLATIGGNISTNAGGMRAVKYGVTRDYVMGLEAVLPDGKVIQAGSKNIKDSSGLSLKNLLIGSEGTLAVITKCILKLVPKPETSVSAVVPFDSLGAGIESVLHIIKESTNPTAIEFVEKKVIKLGEDFLHIRFPYPEAKAYLILTFDGREEEVLANVQRAKNVVLETNALDFIILEDKKLLEDVWKLRGALVKAVEAVSEQEPVDIVVPINRTAEFIGFINELEKESGMQMVSFGHAGDGNVHLCVIRGNRSQAEWEAEKSKNMSAIYLKAYNLGGLTSGEHGIGLSKKEYFLKETDALNLELMRSIKGGFDKKGILNSHKVYNF